MKRPQFLENQAEIIRIKWKDLKKNRIIRYSARIILLCIVLSLASIAWKWNALPSRVPLWYIRPWGESRLAPPVSLFILPLGSLFWYIVSMLANIYITEEHLTFGQIAILSSLLVAVFSFITLVQILFLVT